MKLTDVLEEEYETINQIAQPGELKNSFSKNAVDKIIQMYESILEKKPDVNQGNSMIKSRMNILKTHYSIEDITAFSQVLDEYTTHESFQEITGYFLTKIIMKHYKREQTQREYILVLNETGSYFPYLGCSLDGPNIVVLGNVGRELGKVMKSGSIRVIGNAKGLVGYEMTGGSIFIEGDAGDYVGTTMMGGRIEIKKNTGIDLGINMRNGEIHVDGTIKSVGRNISGGKIYNQGKLYYPQIFNNEEWNKKMREELNKLGKKN